MSRWLHDWYVTIRYGSRFTQAGRRLRASLADPNPEYIEVERPGSDR
jgi:hypothetical protein